MERKCRECGAPVSGRSDKRFCSDDCRTAFHNRRYRIAAKPMAPVNRILRRNRTLLEKVYAAGKRSVPLADIRLKGYDSRYATAVEHHIWRPRRYHCYEYSFTIRNGILTDLTKNDDLAIVFIN